MSEVSYEQASKAYGDELAVDALDLTVSDGELIVLVGPSGSGKSTALRMLAGLEEVDAGAIRIGGEDVTDLPPKQRDVAMVFQNYSLYPYLDVAANMAFPLKMAHVKAAERKRRVQEVAELLDIVPYLGRKPAQLSGGQRQRGAMGRARVGAPRPRPGGFRARGAAEQPRRQAARADAGRDRRAAGAARRDDGVRHPRSG